MKPDMHTIIIIQIISCLLEHHAEEDAEESLCQDTTPHYTADDGKGLLRAIIESDLFALGFV